jgi:hypothetical protein
MKLADGRLVAELLYVSTSSSRGKMEGTQRGKGITGMARECLNPTDGRLVFPKYFKFQLHRLAETVGILKE